MLVRHEVKVVWHGLTDTAACSYSRFEDDELVDRHVIDLVRTSSLPRLAEAFASYLRPALFGPDQAPMTRLAPRGTPSPGLNPGSPDAHAVAAAHYRALADEAREELGLSPFPE